MLLAFVKTNEDIDVSSFLNFFSVKAKLTEIKKNVSFSDTIRTYPGRQKIP